MTNRVVFILVSGLVVASSQLVRSANFVSLGDLPGGVFDSSGVDVSADGTVVIGSSSSDLGLEGFRWTQESGMVGLGELPGGISRSRALEVSARAARPDDWRRRCGRVDRGRAGSGRYSLSVIANRRRICLRGRVLGLGRNSSAQP